MSRPRLRDRFWLLLILASMIVSLPASAQRKDYLSGIEADKIREAETPSLKIKLFISFAGDRLKKFQYELSRTTPDRRRTERLNDLLNAYASCLDDGAELISLGVEKQEDIRLGVKEMQDRAKEFLAYLEKFSASGASELPALKDNLEDAIDSTRQAIKDADKAAKEMSPPPVRRKQ